MNAATKAPRGSIIPANRVFRCAIYTRKSTEEGLEQEFNSLDAQREASEAFIRSQQNEGWVCLPDKYDDGGYSGGNMDRPALKRLMEDVEAQKLDCIVVYKVDRFSRSLLDFARMMEVLERKQVSFVSVTQQFNTAQSMGRLVLNILLSFAQFEREMISERTRDKMAAARRKGKWVGGIPILGFDIDPSARKLLVNEDEAKLARAIFDLYLETQSLSATVTELNRRHWLRKQWQTRSGKPSGGGSWTKANLHHLLTRRTYIGEVEYHGEVYKAEHPGIVDESVWNRVRLLMRKNGPSGPKFRNKHGALLRGLLNCASCNASMTHTYTSKGNKRYRYYLCQTVQKQSWDACPTRSLPAHEIEKFVVDQIRAIGKDPALITAAYKEATLVQQKYIAALKVEQDTIQKKMGHCAGEIRQVLGLPNAATRLADYQEQMRELESRSMMLGSEIKLLEKEKLYEADVETAMRSFDPVWASLTPLEQARLIELLIDRVTYDGIAGTIKIAFRASGIKTLAKENRK